MAALREGSRCIRAVHIFPSFFRLNTTSARRWASAGSSNADLTDLESGSSLGAPLPDEQTIQSFDTTQRVKARKEQLPGSR
jgi:hypothetical protein